MVKPAIQTVGSLITKRVNCCGKKCRHNSHRRAIPGRGEKRDIVPLIKASDKDWVENLIPISHGRMLQSEFALFRGSAALEACDLTGTPRGGITVQACGDCHLMNFGRFATPERNLVFDINDFDEAFPAPTTRRAMQQ